MLAAGKDLNELLEIFNRSNLFRSHSVLPLHSACVCSGLAVTPLCCILLGEGCLHQVAILESEAQTLAELSKVHVF
jgi:hypothetical protein